MPVTTDLSLVHGPAGDLFARDGDDGRFELRDDQVAQFRRDGFLPGVPLLDARQIDALRGELAEFLRPDHAGRELWYEYHSNESTDPDTVLFHALGAWRLRPGMHDLLWHGALLAPAAQLLGGAVRFWHDQLFCKPARHGGVVAWHQDYSYWTRTKPLAHLTCWIGLDDATVENGCVHYVPGSHEWSLLPKTVLAGGMEAIGEILEPAQRDALANPVPCELCAGEAVFHHPLTLHGSFANRSDRPRRAVVINLVRDGVTSDADEPLLTGVPPIPRGEPLGGQFFPLLRPARTTR